MLNEKQVKSVLNKHKQRDNWFLTDYSVNAYEGCSCNCLYCYIRGSKYGENMDTGIVVKSNALPILEKQLHAKAKKGQYGFVTVGSGTDAYMHHEERWKLTEGVLKLLLKYRFPVFISTKSKLILRDIELLKEIDRTAILPPDLQPALRRGVILSVSVSTMDPHIAGMLEPGALLPDERLDVLQRLAHEGFLAGVNAIPVLPFISDSEPELERIISGAKQHKANYILVGGLTLFGSGVADSRTLYFKFLERYNPSLISRYQELYGINYFPPRYYLQQLKLKAEAICAKHKIRSSILHEAGEATT